MNKEEQRTANKGFAIVGQTEVIEHGGSIKNCITFVLTYFKFPTFAKPCPSL